jgi:hypothetical protein
MLETATGATTNDEIVMIVSTGRSPDGGLSAAAIYPGQGPGRPGRGHAARSAARHAAA